MRQQRIRILARELSQRAFPERPLLTQVQNLEIAGVARTQRCATPLLRQPGFPGVDFRSAPDRKPQRVLSSCPGKTQRRASLRAGNNDGAPRFDRRRDRSIKAGRARTSLLLLETAHGIHHPRVRLRQR
jgi:hypothetical protein